VHLGLWKKHGATPLWLVFGHDDFGRGMEARRLLEPWAAREGVVAFSDSDQLAIGLDVAVEEEKDAVVRSLSEMLGRIAAELSILSPRSTQVGPTDE